MGCADYISINSNWLKRASAIKYPNAVSSIVRICDIRIISAAEVLSKNIFRLDRTDGMVQITRLRYKK